MWIENLPFSSKHPVKNWQNPKKEKKQIKDGDLEDI